MTDSSVRLGMETLDPRNAPSSLTDTNTATTDWLGEPADTDWLPAYVAVESAQPGVPSPGGGTDNLSPEIHNFTLVINPGLVGVFSGRVADESVSTVTIRFGGSPQCLQEQTASVAADGTFSFEGQLRAIGDGGYAWAEPVDAQGLVGRYEEVFVYVG